MGLISGLYGIYFCGFRNLYYLRTIVYYLKITETAKYTKVNIRKLFNDEISTLVFLIVEYERGGSNYYFVKRRDTIKCIWNIQKYPENGKGEYKQNGGGEKKWHLSKLYAQNIKAYKKLLLVS